LIEFIILTFIINTKIVLQLLVLLFIFFLLFLSLIFVFVFLAEFLLFVFIHELFVMSHKILNTEAIVEKCRNFFVYVLRTISIMVAD